MHALCSVNQFLLRLKQFLQSYNKKFQRSGLFWDTAYILWWSKMVKLIKSPLNTIFVLCPCSNNYIIFQHDQWILRARPKLVWFNQVSQVSEIHCAMLTLASMLFQQCVKINAGSTEHKIRAQTLMAAETKLQRAVRRHEPENSQPTS